MGKKIEFRPFEEAREFVRNLNLKDLKEWNEYRKSNRKPDNIPNCPEHIYKNKGWKGIGDWLGTGSIASTKREFLSFKEAREFVRSLGFKTQKDWVAYCNSGQRPKNIPSNPSKKYKNEGWKNWSDWIKENETQRFISFEEAREFVRNLGLSSKIEWHIYCRSGQRPKNIPGKPSDVYKNKGWENWKDWLGIDFLSFKEASDFAKNLGLKSKTEWYDYFKSNQRPKYIPANPDVVYKDKGWKRWGDFLGTGNISNSDREFLPFEEAREFVKSLGLKSKREWDEYSKSNKRPINIPSDPSFFYKEFKGYAHFLGYLGNGNVWTKINIIHYLEEIKDYLNICSIPQLITIITANGFSKFFDNSDFKKLQETIAKSKDREDLIEEIILKITNKDDSEIEDLINSEITDNQVDLILNPTSIVETTTDASVIIEELKGLDNTVVTNFLDEEKVAFLINDFINNLWYKVLNGEDVNTLLVELNLKSPIPLKIKKDFLKEYNAVIKLKLPKSWKYHNEPLLMQKLIAYRLKQRKRYGNWSGVGSGKTISAILAGQYVGAKNTLVITFNSTIGSEDQRGWLKEIRDSVKNCNIFSKGEKGVTFDNRFSNYLVLNYESFQQEYSYDFIVDLIKRNNFDYIILDEVQNVKQNSKKEESKRRRIILNLIDMIKEKNPDYYLLAMSATPVINSLSEAKSLVELIESRELDDINVIPTIPNCMNIFQKLTNCGIRYKNVEDNIIKSNKYTLVEIDGNHLRETAKAITEDNYLLIDRMLLETKIKAMLPYINTSKGKTIIYTYYVDGIDEWIQKYLTDRGFKAKIYTGNVTKRDREDSLTDFIEGDCEVLIASRPIGTGVDGLQKVSDRMIILSLPWTNAELVQLVGRINRKGSAFQDTGVDIIIPLVFIDGEEKEYKWDHYRYNSITYKRTIANAAVDGIIPDKIIKSKDPYIKKAKEILPKWIKRMKGEISDSSIEEEV